MLSEKQLPSIMILSLYDMPTLHGASVTGVCNFSMSSDLLDKYSLKSTKMAHSVLLTVKKYLESTKMIDFVLLTEVSFLSLNDLTGNL